MMLHCSGQGLPTGKCNHIAALLTISIGQSFALLLQLFLMLRLVRAPMRGTWSGPSLLSALRCAYTTEQG